MQECDGRRVACASKLQMRGNSVVNQGPITLERVFDAPGLYVPQSDHRILAACVSVVVCICSKAKAKRPPVIAVPLSGRQVTASAGLLWPLSSRSAGATGKTRRREENAAALLLLLLLLLLLPSPLDASFAVRSAILACS